MTRTDMLEWIAFSRLYSWGNEVEEVRWRAIRCDVNFYARWLGYVIGKVFTGKGTRPRAEDAGKFRTAKFHGLKGSKVDLQDMTPEQQRAYIESWAAAMGAKRNDG